MDIVPSHSASCPFFGSPSCAGVNAFAAADAGAGAGTVVAGSAATGEVTSAGRTAAAVKGAAADSGAGWAGFVGAAVWRLASPTGGLEICDGD